MPAFLGKQLVLDLHGGGPGFFEAADHVHDVERLAKAGVAIHQYGQTGCAGDLADVEAHIVDGDHAEIGQAHGRGHGSARQIKSFEPFGLCL